MSTQRFPIALITRHRRHRPWRAAALATVAACALPALGASTSTMADTHHEPQGAHATARPVVERDHEARGAVSIAGVDPRVYLRARKAEPSAVRELRELPAEVAIRILTEGPDAFLADAAHYPAHLTVDEVARLRLLEIRALTRGAMAALVAHAGRSQPALVVAHLRPFLMHPDPTLRAEAAERLGQSGGDVVAMLAGLAWSDPEPQVRAAACAGLGQHRSAEAFAALEPLVLGGNDPNRQVAAVRALGVLSSRWAWQARGASDEGDRLRARARMVMARLEEATRPPAELAEAIRDIAMRLR